MRFLRTKLFALLTLMLCMGVFCATASASDGGGKLTVTAAWVDGELLRINVTDAEGVSSALALCLSDYVSGTESKEYISIQAVDLAGNKSDVIEVKNPYYDPSAAPVVIITPKAEEQEQEEAEQPQSPSSQSAVPEGSNPADDGRPFTPDGAGTVVDNATDGDGKEFFTVGTEDGSVFYLIIDRQRNADNVYLLNAVTEEDLMALAEKNGREITPHDDSGSTSAVTTPEQPNTTDSENQPHEPATEPIEEEAKPPPKNDTAMYILAGVIVLAAGGAGYYFKIVRGRKNAVYDDGEENDANYGYEDSAEDDDSDGDISEDGGGDE